MSFYITKVSGEKELFSIKKFKRSLKKAGASDEVITEIASEIQNNPEIRSTRDIYRYALRYLRKRERPIASRYNLKQALLELGPAGYPFEKFIAELFKTQGYKTTINEILIGMCTDYEIDFRAKKDNISIIGECKFHSSQALKTNVKTPLYVQARFEDIKKIQEKQKNKSEVIKSLTVTNTKFTSKAEQYAECIGQDLLSWSYPEGNTLPDMINKAGVHPITTLTSLNGRQKRELIKNNCVLCNQVSDHIWILKNMGFTDYKIAQLLDEIKLLCGIKNS